PAGPPRCCGPSPTTSTSRSPAARPGGAAAAGVGEDVPMSRATLDKVCAAAVEDARAALLAVAPADEVGDWIEAVPDAERVVTHYFTAHSPSYVGWRWAVTLARASRAKSTTVDEIVLLPGDGALL